MSNTKKRNIITLIELFLLAAMGFIVGTTFPLKQAIGLSFVIGMTVLVIALNDARCNLYKEDEEDDMERIERERLNLKK